MKKFIKNILLTFVIIFTILTLVRYSINIISRRIMLNEITTAYLDNNINIEGSMEVEKNAKESIEEIRKSYGEGVPATALVIFRSYILGMDLVLDSELTILLTTLILSISIGTIVSLTEKSKIKELIV